jgi:DNA-binding beta-propeller fold protein YncE/mono/diheme cytochrome c family protein
MTAVRRSAVVLVLLAAAPLLRAADPPDKTPEGPQPVSYYRDVRPIFQQHCQGCHQPAKPLGGLVMTEYAELLKKGMSEEAGIVPGHPDQSHIFHEITPNGSKKPAMPKGKDPLLPVQVELIRKWIAQGAKDDTPASARVVVDADHPPSYVLPPVIPSLAYSPDGKLLAVAGYHEVLLHHADGSGLVGRLVGLSERVQSVAFSPDGTLLAVAGGSPCRFGEIQVWDVAKRKLKLSVPITFDTVYGVSWSPDGSKIAFGCADNTVRAIDATTGKQVLQMGTHADWALDTTFSTDGQYLVSVGRDRSMRLTEVATQRFIDNVTSITPGALKDGLLTVARRPLKERKMVKSPPDPTPHLYNEMLAAGADGTPRLYKMHRETKRVIGDDANRIREYPPMPGRVFSVAFNADGSLFVAGSSLEGHGEAWVYQTNDGKVVAKLQGQKGAVFAVAFRPDGKQVATAGFDGVVRLSDPKTGKLIEEFVPVPRNAGVASK